MTFKLAPVPVGGGQYVKNEELAKAAALLIEPKRFEPMRPSGGTYGPKDTIHADVTIFATEADVQSAKPTEMKPGAMLQATLLVRDLQSLIGAATACTIEKKNFKGGTSGWVMVDLPPAAQAKIVEYGTARNAQLDADVESGPDF
ncbi:MAG: hypothetical protein ACRCYU_12300 [Nocardioides sp.]